MPTRKSTITLSDGRRLHYFDERSAVRGTADPRGLAPADTSVQLRWNPVDEQWVVVAAHRQVRTHLPPTDECPLCPSRDGRHTEIPARDYDVVVFDNRFPSLTPARGVGVGVGVGAGNEDGAGNGNGDVDRVGGHGRYPPGVRAGGGSCEVVCFTSDHHASFSTLGRERVGTILDAWIDRTTELGRRPDVEQVFVFENRGEEIGVTQPHPHGQIYAYPFVPPRMARMLASARRRNDTAGDCLFCHVLATERTAGVRVVAENECWTAFVPHAARWPYEVHLYARRHTPDLPSLSARERDLLADIYPAVLRRFDRLFDTATPYVAAWIQAPARSDRDLAHLHAQVFTVRRAAGKLKFLAGSESAAGAFVNDVAPETAAARLRGEQPAD